MKKWLRLGICLVLTICFLVLPACKPGPVGTDSTGASVTDATDETLSAEITQLKAKFPMYFDLPADKGLEVYIWALKSATYYCGLLPGKNLNYTPEELRSLGDHPATIEEMQDIVDYYIAEGAVTREAVTVYGINIPYDLETDPYDVEGAFHQGVNYLFWGADPILAYAKDKTILDAATFDIDGDGVKEQCAMVGGSISIRQVVIFLVCENDKLECFNQFESRDFLYVDFEKDENGQTLLLATELERIPDPVSPSSRPGKQHRLRLGVEDGNVVIYDNGQLFSYYGKQGLDAPDAPK